MRVGAKGGKGPSQNSFQPSLIPEVALFYLTINNYPKKMTIRNWDCKFHVMNSLKEIKKLWPTNSSDNTLNLLFGL